MKENILLYIFTALFVFGFMVTGFCATEKGLAESAEKTGKWREALAHYTVALQEAAKNNSSDIPDLEKKNIEIYLKLDPKPLLSEEARRHVAYGEAAVEIAKDPEGFKKAADEFSQALLIAPWYAKGYFNLGLVQEKAGDYQEAMQDLRLYLIAEPNAPDAEEVQTRIMKIEYKEKQATQARSEANAKRAKLESLLGQWDYELNLYGTRFTGTLMMTQQNNILELRSPNTRDEKDRTAPVDNANTSDPFLDPISIVRGTLQGPDVANIKWEAYKHDFFNGECQYKGGYVEIPVTISPDFKQIQFSYPAIWKHRENMSSPLFCDDHSFDYTLRHR